MSIAYANFELHSVGVVSLRHDKVSRAKTAKKMMIKKCCDSYRVTTKVQRTPVQELCAEDGGGPVLGGGRCVGILRYIYCALLIFSRFDQILTSAKREVISVHLLLTA